THAEQLVEHCRQSPHRVGTEIEWIAQTEPPCRAAPRAEERDQRTQFILAAQARPGVEAQSCVTPQAVAPLMPRCGDGNRSREFGAGAGIAAERQWKRYVVERLHVALLGIGKSCESVAAHL